MTVKGKHKLQIHNRIDIRTDFSKNIWNAQTKTMEKVHSSMKKKTIKIDIEEELNT